MSDQRALITGATSGIGLELAREFARRGHPVAITGRSEEELQSLANELMRLFNVPVKFFAIDLQEPQASERIFSGLQQDGTEIEILVNNAGFGQRGKFWEIPLDQYVAMLRVNVEAVVGLSRLFLPLMVAKGRGRLLNTASVAGFEPGPGLAVYHATKAFVLSVTEAIATELEGTGVTATALCPGATDTDFFPKADMVDTQIFQKGNVAAPSEVAQAGYEAMMRGDRVYVHGALNKALVFSRRILPIGAQAKVNEGFYKDTKPQDRKRVSGQIRRDKAHRE